MAETGLSPPDALRAAIPESVRYMDATDSMVTMDKGKLADPVLLADAEGLAGPPPD